MLLADYFSILISQILLASRGVDPEKLRKILTTIDLKTAYEPLEPIEETDVEGYLKHEQELIILTAIEESKRDVSKLYISCEKRMKRVRE
jgi:nuclear pore complex protein Nup93